MPRFDLPTWAPSIATVDYGVWHHFPYIGTETACGERRAHWARLEPLPLNLPDERVCTACRTVVCTELLKGDYT